MSRKPNTRRSDPLRAVAGLLVLWIGIELLHSSRWLELGEILAATQTTEKQQQARQPQSARKQPAPAPRPPLRALLTAAAGAGPGGAAALPRVWFAPYTTFPETGMVESLRRRGVYDTFLAFPASGITGNYGAFKLSAADSAFAQAATGGLPREAELARRLGYRWFAVDLGAIEDPSGLRRLCEAMSGCRLSGDGYALFPLGAGASAWEPRLAAHRRRMPELAQVTAAPRWGSLVFEPGGWWPSDDPGGSPAGAIPAGRHSVRVRPVWTARLFRFAPAAVPSKLRPLLTPAGERIWLQLAPGLRQVELCLQTQGPRWPPGATPPCREITLTRQRPRLEVSRWLPPGRVTTIETRWLFGLEGLPLTPEHIPVPEGSPPRPSAFAVEVENPSIPAVAVVVPQLAPGTSSSSGAGRADAPEAVLATPP